MKKVDRDFGVVKINVHKNASYSRFLEKCIKEEDEGYDFSLMDSQGLIIDQPNGIDEELPWTLETYQEDVYYTAEICCSSDP